MSNLLTVNNDLIVSGNIKLNNSIKDSSGSSGTNGQVLTSIGNGWNWEDKTDTTYTQGTGVTINGSNQISIGQPVGTTNSPSFKTLNLTDAVSGNQLVLSRSGGFANINFKNTSNNHRWRFAGPGGMQTSGIFSDPYGLAVNYNNGTTEFNQYHFMSNGSLAIKNTFYSNKTITVSDDRIKFNEKIINNGLNTILQLKPVKYDKSLILNVEENTEKEAGFIAQEVFEIPELKPYVVEGTEEDFWRLNYSCIIPYLVSAIKEQNEVINSLKERIEVLEAR